MTREQAATAVGLIFPGCYVLWLGTAEARVEVGSIDFTVSYEQLRKLADIFGTTDIHLHHEHRFGGSDVTPAEPDELEFIIRGHVVTSGEAPAAPKGNSP